VLSSVKVSITEAKKLSHKYKELSISRQLVQLLKISYYLKGVVKVLLK
jgi:hypothetical protein